MPGSSSAPARGTANSTRQGAADKWTTGRLDVHIVIGMRRRYAAGRAAVRAVAGGERGRMSPGHARGVQSLAIDRAKRLTATGLRRIFNRAAAHIHNIKNAESHTITHITHELIHDFFASKVTTSTVGGARGEARRRSAGA